MSQKLKVAVVFGGRSSEHEVSRISASYVIRNLCKEKYDIIKIGISKSGLWRIYQGPVESIESGRWEEGLADQGISAVEEAARSADVFFPVLHGLYGEDGTIQGLFELIDKPYVGPGVLSSALGMDKVYTKIIFGYEGIPQARYLVFRRSQIEEDRQAVVEQIEAKLGYPCFVKPSNSGSSIGISKAHNRAGLMEGLTIAGKYDTKIIVEEFIEAREVECSVLGDREPVASVVGEVLPSREFYDYDSKYNDGTSQIIIPADIDEETAYRIRNYAIRAFKALDCSGMSRVDFFVHKKTGRIYINEINTIPGFTGISMYPMLMEASGIRYSDLLDRLIELAFERYREKNRYYECKADRNL